VIGATSAGSLVVEILDRLADFESVEFPVVSLYLDTRPDATGRDHWSYFVRKELPARVQTYPRHSAARESLDRDVERIGKHLESQLPVSANGAALFASSGGTLFEVLTFEVPFEEDRLSVSSRPHLYPLARVIDEYPRFVVVVADTQSARILVFGLGRRIDTRTVQGRRIHRTDVGGWSQMRYQRHVDEIRQHNVREIVATLEKVIRQDRSQHLILAGDEEVLPMLRKELTKEMTARVIDVLRMDAHAPERQILDASMEALKAWDAKSDAMKVERALEEYRAGGLAVIGPEAVEAALATGQVEELLIAATLPPPSGVKATSGAPGLANVRERPLDEGSPTTSELADELVRMARRTSARVTFIEDARLLAEGHGVAGLLRFRFSGTGLEKNP
jgi:peptide chain release factor subunit 1